MELFFIEPWYRQQDAEGLRLFDVAVNDSIVIHDLDIWAQAHYGKPYKRVVEVENHDEEICIDFPKVKAGQATISAIAIARQGQKEKPAPPTPKTTHPTMWSDFNSDILVKTPDSLLPPKSNTSLEVEGKKVRGHMEWDFNVGVAKVYALRWKYYNPEMPRRLRVRITDANGVVYKEDDITFLQTQQKATKRKTTSITTGSQVNAGQYHVVLTGEGIDKMLFDALCVE